MAQPKSVVDLDVHATQTHACVLSPEARERSPTGHGLASRWRRARARRACLRAGVDPNRIKTDRRDAERLARLCLAGELSFVRGPSPEEERFRDLARAREAIRADLMRARHRRRSASERAIEELWPESPWAETIARLPVTLLGSDRPRALDGIYSI